MTRSRRPAHCPPPKSFTATISLHTQDLQFKLYTRPLRLGSDIEVQYYWMNSANFRIARTKRELEFTNFRNCVSHWWLAMRSQGVNHEPVQIRHLILAICYVLVSRNNSLQQVYKDAYLKPQATAPQEQSLPDSVRRRIKAVVRSQDRERVRQDLDRLLGGANVAGPEDIAANQLIELILRHGVSLIQRLGDEGLHHFVAKFDAWSKKTRKKGGKVWQRQVLNRLAYESKVSFYRCYANTWIDLIPWLKEHRGLDERSERFLRLWHMQNQPIELPGGRVIPDVFNGQVLSLHPLSGFFMKDPALCAIAGRFINSESFDQVMTAGEAKKCGEYWGFVGAILTAAHLYRQALDEQFHRRGVRERISGDPDVGQVASEDRSKEGLIEELVEIRGDRCSQCNGKLRLQGMPAASPKAKSVQADFTCRACGTGVSLCITLAELKRLAKESTSKQKN